MKRPPARALAVALALLLVLGSSALPGGAAQALPVSAIYLPILVRPPSRDLCIDALEVTQSVQDTSNSVPLVAGKSTCVRIYARVSGGTVSGVAVTLHGSRGGVPLPGSPLTVVPAGISSSPSRRVYGSSVNLTLPDSWLAAGAISVTATVDAQHAVYETDEANNTRSATLTLNSVPPLSLKIVPVNYTHTPTGAYYPAPSLDTISAWVRRTYPLSAVNVTVRSAVSFSGNLDTGASWSALLDLIGDRQVGDGAPSGQVYYGFVSTRNAASDWLGFDGIVGISYIGWRAAVGLDLPVDWWGTHAAGQVAAHEIGHAFGRRHAPCGNVSNVDGAYPYAGGSIGQYGLDTTSSTVWNPDPYQSTSNPYGALDMMSYCDPPWLSDYTYRALYADQLSRGALSLAALSEALRIRVVAQDGAVTIQPVYALLGTPTQADGAEHTLELLDAAGQVMATHPVLAYEIETPHPLGECGDSPLMAPAEPAWAVHAVVPRPAEPVARLRLLHGTEVLAERALDAPEGAALSAGLVVAEDAEPVLRWGAPETPALVRVSADGGATWEALAVDLLGGALPLDEVSLPSGSLRFEVSLADHTGPPMVVDWDGLR
ncbi:MAG: hypothetical protein ACYC5M_14480 [Anaerolineae bacterium]